MIENGILLLNKPKGVSSNKIDNVIKRKYGFSKVGHLGTLDPQAEGLLVLIIGKATKCAKYFDFDSKEYIFTLQVGATSDSLDLETELKDKVDCDLRGKESLVDEVIKSHIGRIPQLPPLYSAIKVNGTKLYEYARKNADIKVDERDVTAYSIERISDIEYKNQNSYMDIKCHVSKGYYIRSLARDLGKDLNYPSLSASIKRLSVGFFTLDKAADYNNLPDSLDLLDPYEYIEAEKVIVNDKILKMVLNGVKLYGSTFKSKDLVKIYDKNDELIAIYKYNKDLDLFEMDLLIKNENN